MNSKWINAFVLWFAIALAGFKFCTEHEQYALKYYPVVKQFHFDPSGLTKEEQFARTKFCNTAVMCMVLALPALLIGWLLPRKSAVVVHLAAWGTLIACSVVIIQAQLDWFCK